MSWLRLLSVGRSLARVGDQPSRYKMGQQILLPKFGKLGAENLSFPAAAKDSARSRENAVNDKNNMNTVEGQFPAVQATAAMPPQAAFPLGRWTIFKNPFTRKPRPEINAVTVQGELALGAVKPVRNDLTDSDLEIIGTKRSEPVSPVPDRVDDLVWQRMKNQFIGSGKV